MNSDNNNLNGEAFRPNTPKAERLSLSSAVVLSVAAAVMMLLSSAAALLPSDTAGSPIVFGTGLFGIIFIILSCGITAFVTCMSPMLSPVAPVLAIMGAVALRFSFGEKINVGVLFAILWMLLPFVGGLALAIATRNACRRTTAIVAVAAVIGVFSLLLFLAEMYVASGRISVDAIIDSINLFRGSLIDAFESQTDAFAELYRESSLEQINIEATVNSFFNLLPSMIVLCFSVIGFFAQKLMFMLYGIYRLSELLTREMKDFVPNKITAIVFVAAYLVSFLSSQGSLTRAISDNLYCILEPALAVFGAISLKPQRVGNFVRVGCFPIIGIAFLFVFMPSLAFLLLAVIGTVKLLKPTKKI